MDKEEVSSYEGKVFENWLREGLENENEASLLGVGEDMSIVAHALGSQAVYAGVVEGGGGDGGGDSGQSDSDDYSDDGSDSDYDDIDADLAQDNFADIPHHHSIRKATTLFGILGRENFLINMRTGWPIFNGAGFGGVDDDDDFSQLDTNKILFADHLPYEDNKCLMRKNY